MINDEYWHIDDFLQVEESAINELYYDDVGNERNNSTANTAL